MNYLQLNEHSKFDKEEQELADFFGEGNYTPYYKKHMVRGKIKVTKDDFVAGEIPSTFAALKQLGVDYEYQDYPESLSKYLHRNIWISTMAEIRSKLFDTGQIDPVFIKPKDSLKKFTGFVITCIDDLMYTNHAGNNTSIYCSEPVIWLSEFRCPVINEEVRGMFRVPYTCHDTDVHPDFNVVQQMADDFKDSPKAYCLDVGVLSTGETALIEVNDGFSVGMYGMSKELYAELLQTRWKELAEKGKDGSNGKLF